MTKKIVLIMTLSILLIAWIICNQSFVSSNSIHETTSTDCEPENPLKYATRNENEIVFSLDLLEREPLCMQPLEELDTIYKDFAPFPDRPVEANKIAFKKQLLSEQYHISHFYYNYLPDDPNSTPIGSEYITIFDKKIELKTLFNQTLNNEKCLFPFPCFDSNFSFEHNNSLFVLLQGKNRVCVKNVDYAFRILIEMGRTCPKNVYAFMDGSLCDSLGCFGLFDQKGNLNYIDWGIDKDTISIYTLKNEKFIKSNDFYIIIKASDGLKNDREDRGYHSCNDRVDYEASRWFYNLRKGY